MKVVNIRDKKWGGVFVNLGGTLLLLKVKLT